MEILTHGWSSAKMEPMHASTHYTYDVPTIARVRPSRRRPRIHAFDKKHAHTLTHTTPVHRTCGTYSLLQRYAMLSVRACRI